ncbi:LysR family transcriptional regulator [Pseudomonas idahonensis]
MRVGQVSDIDIRLLRVFRAVVECGGFSAAEIELNISRAAISLSMANLESRLGVCLCKRGRSGFALTVAGQSIYDASLQLFAAIGHFRTQVNSATTQLRGELNIGITDNLVTSPHMRMTEALKILRAKGPDIQVNVHMTTPSSVARGVFDGHFHIGAIPTTHRVNGLDYRPLYAEESQLYCSHEHPLFGVEDESSILERLPLCDAVTIAQSQEPEVIKYSKKLKVMATSSDREGVAFLILSGEYIGYLPSHYAQRWVDAERMRALCPEHYRYCTQLSVITRPDQAGNLLLDHYLQALESIAP